MDVVASRSLNRRDNPVRHVDLVLLGVAILLILTGLVLLYSATASTLRGGGYDPMSRVKKQLIVAVLGTAIAVALASVDYRFFKVYGIVIYGFILLALVAVLIPGIGSSSGGAQRWFKFGGAAGSAAGIQISPSEFTKLALVFVLAAILSEVRGETPVLSTVIKVTLLAAVPMGFVFLQPDLGTTIALAVVVLGMLVVAGIRPKHLALLAVAAALLFAFAFQTHLIKSYQIGRLTSFLSGDKSTAASSTYNRDQALIAVASGGIDGKGYLGGPQTQLDFVPEQHTDFIFTVAGEEFGFVGSTFILMLFGLLLWRAVRIAFMSKDLFGTYVAAGIASMFAIHILVNVGMVIGIMPITGIPLPFMSYGGSSMLICVAAIGVLQNIHMRRGA